MNYKIVGLGEILWDMFPMGKQLGGAPANFAYHAKTIANEEVESYVVSCIGRDTLGEEIYARLTDLNIKLNHLNIDSNHPTGTVTVELNESGSPTYTIDKNVAWDNIPTIPVKFAEQVDAVCFGSLAQRSSVSKQSITNFLEAVSTHALRIFDINLRQSFYSIDVIKESLKLSNVLKINDEEIKVVAKLLSIDGNDDDILQEIFNRYELTLGVLTKGNKGSTLISENKVSYHSGYSVNVVDSVGAGDSFTAAIAFGLLNDYDLDHINDCANRLASFVCTCSGATPQISEEIKTIFKPK